MASRRDQIRMTDEELRGFLAEQKIVSCATIGPNGRPHLVPLWYVPDGDVLSGWTYRKSQKARNLERDPRATLQVEDGVQYHELRGVMMECDVELENDTERVGEFGVGLFERYAGAKLGDDARAAVLAQAPKRVGLRFVPTRIVSWDHRKLEGVY
ncbi:MAG TPA: PPOX class F420-dependent oxidoreductase [Thermoleophilaceae bacterium]